MRPGGRSLEDPLFILKYLDLLEESIVYPDLHAQDQRQQLTESELPQPHPTQCQIQRPQAPPAK